MRTLIRYVLLIPTGYLLACVAAAWVVSVGVYGTRYDLDMVGQFVTTFGIMTALAAKYAFLPWLAAIVLAEIMGWRSVIFWMLFGGLIGLVEYQFVYAVRSQLGDNNYVMAFVAGGFTAGFVYWLIAGRLSGERTPSGSVSPAA